MCTGLSESWQSHDSMQAPAPDADSGLSFTPGQGCISPHLLMLDSVIQSSQSPPSSDSLSNSPPEASQATPPASASPPATASHSPAQNLRRPLTCHHCHIRFGFDVTALWYASLACLPRPGSWGIGLPC